MFSTIQKLKDTFLNSDYTLATTDAKILSDYLKTNITNKGLDISYFNRQLDDWHSKNSPDITTPPTEIYEYQPFFLLKRNGEYLLLDGFRRLLWYNTPVQPIQIRIYEDLSDTQIIKLLVYLNHFKFYGGTGQYFDRGFTLAFKTIFDIDITKIYSSLDGYLSKKGTGRYNDSQLTEKNLFVKDRILNPMFLSDIRFLSILNIGNVILNSRLGAFFYQKRIDNPDMIFDADKFVELYNKNPNIAGLEKKYFRGGTYKDNATENLIEEYENILNQINGGEVIESLEDLKKKAKSLSDSLIKDGYIKISGSKNASMIETSIGKFFEENKKSPELKAVIFPNSAEDKDNVKILDFVMVDFQRRGNLGREPKIVLVENEKWKIKSSTISNYYHIPYYKEVYWMGSSDSDKVPLDTKYNSFKIEFFVKM